MRCSLLFVLLVGLAACKEIPLESPEASEEIVKVAAKPVKPTKNIKELFAKKSIKKGEGKAAGKSQKLAGVGKESSIPDVPVPAQETLDTVKVSSNATKSGLDSSLVPLNATGDQVPKNGTEEPLNDASTSSEASQNAAQVAPKSKKNLKNSGASLDAPLADGTVINSTAVANATAESDDKASPKAADIAEDKSQEKSQDEVEYDADDDAEDEAEKPENQAKKPEDSTEDKTLDEAEEKVKEPASPKKAGAASRGRGSPRRGGQDAVEDRVKRATEQDVAAQLAAIWASRPAKRDSVAALLEFIQQLLNQLQYCDNNSNNGCNCCGYPYYPYYPYQTQEGQKAFNANVGGEVGTDDDVVLRASQDQTPNGAPWSGNGQPWPQSGLPYGQPWPQSGLPYGQPWPQSGLPNGQPWAQPGPLNRPPNGFGWSRPGPPQGKPWPLSLNIPQGVAPVNEQPQNKEPAQS